MKVRNTFYYQGTYSVSKNSVPLNLFFFVDLIKEIIIINFNENVLLKINSDCNDNKVENICNVIITGLGQ